MVPERLRILAALLWLLSGTVDAADLWDELGPAHIAANREDIAKQVPLACVPAPAPRVCTTGAGSEFAGLPVVRLELHFAKERLTRVTVIFSEQHYRTMLDFLAARFGASDDRSFRARGGMAAEFEAGVHLWEHEGVSIVLEQFAGKIDRSALSYGSDAAMAELVRSKTSYPRGARRDL
jgi:hypothetical protein